MQIMINKDDRTIHFSAADVPDLPELRTKGSVPEPEDWKPFGCEW